LNTDLEKRNGNFYTKTRDVFKSLDFHSKCDDKRSIITIITSKEGFYFVGYTSLSWNSSNQFVQDSSKKSFIFSLTNPHSIPLLKYLLIQPEKAILCHPDFSHTFGCSRDICLSDQSDQNTSSGKGFSYSYSDITGKENIIFTGNNNFSIKKLKFSKFQIKK
jgi:hypothetical protein